MELDKKTKNELKKDIFTVIEGTLSGYNKEAADKFNKSLKLFTKLISKKFNKVVKKTERKKKITGTNTIVVKKKTKSKGRPAKKKTE